jgi:hypothetical protein
MPCQIARALPCGFSKIHLLGSVFFVCCSMVVFNYGFVATVPSWLNEKSPHVSPTETIWVAVGSATFLYIILGIFGALALDFRCSQATNGLILPPRLPSLFSPLVDVLCLAPS